MTTLVDPASLRQRQRRRIDRTARVVALGIFASLALVLARVAQLQLAPDPGLQPFIQDRVTRRTDPAPRGDLLDRRGRVIAATRTGYRLFVDPATFTEPFTPKMQEIARAIDADVERVAERLLPRIEASRRRAAEGRSPIRYVAFPSVLTDDQYERARAIKIPGVHLERRNVREITAGPEAASIAGKVGIEEVGLIGAERIFDAAMQAQPGHMDYVRDARGRPMWVEAHGIATPIRGKSARLSIDLELQRIAHEEIVRGVEAVDAAGGRLIMVDPHTGEILAMVDHIRDVRGLAPIDAKGKYSTDPAIRYRTIPQDTGRASDPALARNRCVEDTYEPGSTFKSFLWSSALERGVVRPDEIINTHHGRWTTDYGRKVEDVTPMGQLTWKDVLVYSSNIGMAQVTRRMTDEQLRTDILRFGFGRRTGIGLPGESPGIVTTARNWTKYTQTSVAMGYEVGVTPLQMVRAFSAFARTGDKAGTLPVLRLTAAGGDEPTLAEFEHRVLPPWVAELTRTTMRNVAENMARRATRSTPADAMQAGGMFGKSGTAKIVRPGGKGYFERQYNSSFIAGAPVDEPRIVVLVVIDDPGPAFTSTRRYFGSQVAGPVVLRVVNRSLAYLGIAPDDRDAERIAAAGE